MKPLVSIVIPVYNSEKYVGVCLDSLIRQTYAKLEIICVDDGSNDSSREIICEYMERDKRVQLITQRHKNAGRARNNGLEMAQGEFIAFLDSDDFFEPALVEKMVEKITATQSDCVICRTTYFDNESGNYNEMGLKRFHKMQIPDWNNFSRKDIPDYIFQLSACAWDKLYRLSFIKENSLQFQEQQANNDMLFVYKSYVLANRMAICDDVAVRYRMNNTESIQGSWGKYWPCIFSGFRSLKEWLREMCLWEQVEKSFVNNAAAILISYMDRLSEWSLYVEYFDYYKSEGIPELGLFPKEKEYYYNPLVYDRIKYIFSHDCKEYLLYQKNQLVSSNREYVFRLNAMKKNFEERLNKSKIVFDINKRKRWYFQEERLTQGSRLAVYGYGDVGNDLVEQLSESGRFTLKLVVDKNYAKIGNGLIRVRPVKEIYTAVFDYIIIAVSDKKTAEEIRDTLIDEGICKEKIVWFEEDW